MVHRLIGKKVVGVKQTLKFMKNDKGRVLYIAKNADEKLVEPVINLAIQKSLEIVYIDSMKELGKLCGIEVGAATALVLE